MRYLAEIALAPDVVLRNTKLRWRVDAPDKIAVSAGSSEAAAEVVLTLGDEGRIAGTFAPDRPRFVTAPFPANTLARPALRLPPSRGAVAPICR